MKIACILTLLVSLVRTGTAQQAAAPFRIRTITAGVTIQSLSDTQTIQKALLFLAAAKKELSGKGYEIQTLRIATSNIYTIVPPEDLMAALPQLQQLDQQVTRAGAILSIGQVLAPDQYNAGIGEWAAQLVRKTRSISFSLAISSHAKGIHTNAVRAAAEIIRALSKEQKGEANFRFTASANCPAGIPFFPAAFHEGINSFAIGLESAGVLTAVFAATDREHAKAALKVRMEQLLQPVQRIAENIAATTHWQYDGIDASPAPGLDASIGQAIETYTKQPFGSPSTLGACAMITDVLKSLEVKRCGYSGLMLPVIEDKVLARRAAENRYTVQEILLFSSVSGTGLDVVPIPGDTPQETLEGILTDVAALSLKYTAKALSVRLFPIPGKRAGDNISFDNPNLTSTRVMAVQ